MNARGVIFGENAGLADYVARIESARVYDVARVTSLDRARRLSDGRVDLAEARRILTLLDEGFTPSEPLARLMTLLRTAVGDGAVSEAQSRDIARALDETLNLRMGTAEERRRFMY